MDNPWRLRWQEGRIGFHLAATHTALPQHWPELGVEEGAKVLVPLCGKSLDMRWLAEQGEAADLSVDDAEAASVSEIDAVQAPA